MNIGDRVTVTEGPYAGRSGTVTDLAGIRAGVLIDYLGKRRSIRCDDLRAAPVSLAQREADHRERVMDGLV